MGEETGANAARFSPEADDVFGRIADRYDGLCDLFSLGAHRLWKQHMARRLAEVLADQPRAVVLDLASGTGDIPLRLLRRLPLGERRLWVTDLSDAMLAKARTKLADAPPGLTYDLADAEALASFADGSVNVISISFAMKICDRARVIGEVRRVLAPGGWFFCLEASTIPLPWLRGAYLAYMDWCLPLIARLATGGDRSAYDYLLRGVHDFPDGPDLAAELRLAGFDTVTHKPLTLGIVALHRARQPAG